MATVVITPKQNNIDTEKNTYARKNPEPDTKELAVATGLLDLFNHKIMESKVKTECTMNENIIPNQECVPSSELSTVSSTTTTPSGDDSSQVQENSSSDTITSTEALGQENKAENIGLPSTLTHLEPVKKNAMSIRFESTFLKRYWRNDRKNIQCFPFCPEFGDYYTCRVNGYEHRPRKGACREPISLQVEFTKSKFDLKKLTVLGRFVVCTASAESMTTTDHTIDPKHRHELFPNESIKTLCANHGKLTRTELTKLAKLSYQAKHNMESTMSMKQESNGIVNASFKFVAESWRIEVPLSKRRHSPNKPSMVQKYCFEVLVFDEVENPLEDPSREGKYQLVARRQSQFFEIANTRTLVRKLSQLQKTGPGTKKAAPTRVDPYQTLTAKTENRVSGQVANPTTNGAMGQNTMMQYQSRMNSHLMQQPYLHQILPNMPSPMMHPQQQQQQMWNPHQFAQFQLAQNMQQSQYAQNSQNSQNKRPAESQGGRDSPSKVHKVEPQQQAQRDMANSHQPYLQSQNLVPYQLLLQQQQMQRTQSPSIVVQPQQGAMANFGDARQFYQPQIAYNPMFMNGQMQQLHQQMQQLQQQQQQQQARTEEQNNSDS